MSQKLPAKYLKQVQDFSEFDGSFIKSYNEESDEGYLLEVDVPYLENLHNLHNDLPFLLGRIKIEKVGKLIANLYNKTQYVTHISNLKQVFNHGLVLEKVHTVIKFSQKAWLEPYIDMNTELRKKKKN